MKKIIAAVYMFTRALHLNLWTRVLRPVVLGELPSPLTLGSNEGKDDHHDLSLYYEE